MIFNNIFEINGFNQICRIDFVKSHYITAKNNNSTKNFDYSINKY